MSRHLDPDLSPRARCLENAAKIHRRMTGAAAGISWQAVPPRPGTGRHRGQDDQQVATEPHASEAVS